MGSNFCTGQGHCSEVKGKRVLVGSTQGNYSGSSGLIKHVKLGAEERADPWTTEQILNCKYANEEEKQN